MYMTDNSRGSLSPTMLSDLPGFSNIPFKGPNAAPPAGAVPPNSDKGVSCHQYTIHIHTYIHTYT